MRWCPKTTEKLLVVTVAEFGFVDLPIPSWGDLNLGFSTTMKEASLKLCFLQLRTKFWSGIKLGDEMACQQLGHLLGAICSFSGPVAGHELQSQQKHSKNHVHRRS